VRDPGRPRLPQAVCPVPGESPERKSTVGGGGPACPVPVAKRLPRVPRVSLPPARRWDWRHTHSLCGVEARVLNGAGCEARHRGVARERLPAGGGGWEVRDRWRWSVHKPCQTGDVAEMRVQARGAPLPPAGPVEHE